MPAVPRSSHRIDGLAVPGRILACKQASHAVSEHHKRQPRKVRVRCLIQRQDVLHKLSVPVLISKMPKEALTFCGASMPEMIMALYNCIR